MAEQYIQLVANYQDWVAIKKLKIDGTVDPKTVMEFLAGLNTSIDFKVEANLGKIVDLTAIKAAVQELSVGKKESDIAGVLAAVASSKVNKTINEAVLPLEGKLQKNEVKEITDFCKTYAMRLGLKQCGLMVDYSAIAIPGMKRLKKKEKPGKVPAKETL